ncbi:MAG: SAM-dependent methyltransferase [Gaiellales bacterium]
MTVEELVAGLVADGALTGATLSKPAGGDPGHAKRVTVDPVDVRAGERYRWRHHHDTRTVDELLAAEETAARLAYLVGGSYRQALLRSADADFQVLAGGSGPARVLRRPPSRPVTNRAHDRAKRRLLPEGVPVPFLVELGVMTAAGEVRAKRRDKLTQVNRFLEIVEGVLAGLPPGPVRVVDFGSGRSYLTFAVHHLLEAIQGRDVEVIGLDLKQDVVAECNALVAKLGLTGIRFEVGDIATAAVAAADVVVSLHACDTATDAALARAVELDAKVVLAVPCCQHELLGQLDATTLEPLLRHGVLRERLAAEVTDAARARLLALCEYDVHLVELFALEHSPKNVLIRGSKLPRPRPAHDTARLAAGYRAFADALAIEPALERMLMDRLPAEARR